jgi:hypothetical protein
MVLSTSVTAFASTEKTIDHTKDSSNNFEEDRTGKKVIFFMDSNGNVTVIEGNQNNFNSLRAAGELEPTYGLFASTDELVGTYTFSSTQTAEIYRNIKDLTQTINLIAVLSLFVPNPYAQVFLAVARVGIFAEDLEWAGLNGKSVVMEEWCHLPHTSYSHYFVYTIL